MTEKELKEAESILREYKVQIVRREPMARREPVPKQDEHKERYYE